MKDHRINMPKEGKTCDNAHEIDQDHGRELNVARARRPLRISPHEKAHDSQFFKEAEELIEKPGFAKAVHFRNVLAFGKILGDSGLVPGSSTPGQALSNSLRCLVYQFHERHPLPRCRAGRQKRRRRSAPQQYLMRS